MILLYLCIFIILFGGGFLLYTQILMPIIKSTKLFPAFRPSEIEKEVEEIRNTVAEMKEYATSLDDLVELENMQADLEKKIAKVRKKKTEV